MTDEQTRLREDCGLSPGEKAIKSHLDRALLAELNRQAFYLRFECQSLAVAAALLGTVSGFLVFHQLWVSATIAIILTTAATVYGFSLWMNLDAVNRALARVQERGQD
jgi:hypothetical protein